MQDVLRWHHFAFAALQHKEKWLHSQFEDGMSEDDREELRQGRQYANPNIPVRVEVLRLTCSGCLVRHARRS